MKRRDFLRGALGAVLGAAGASSAAKLLGTAAPAASGLGELRAALEGAQALAPGAGFALRIENLDPVLFVTRFRVEDMDGWREYLRAGVPDEA